MREDRAGLATTHIQRRTAAVREIRFLLNTEYERCTLAAYQEAEHGHPEEECADSERDCPLGFLVQHEDWRTC